MLLRKYLSLLGVGSAKIDLILEKETYRPGDSVKGYFLITGGTIEQKIKQIDCDLVQTDKKQGIEKIIKTTSIQNSAIISSEESNKIPFVFQLPVTVSVSSKVISYRFTTRLTFYKGLESRDQDFIKIIP